MQVLILWDTSEVNKWHVLCLARHSCSCPTWNSSIPNTGVTSPSGGKQRETSHIHRRANSEHLSSISQDWTLHWKQITEWCVIHQRPVPRFPPINAITLYGILGQRLVYIWPRRWCNDNGTGPDWIRSSVRWVHQLSHHSLSPSNTSSRILTKIPPKESCWWSSRSPE